MAKFYGAIGFGHTVETSPGIHEMVITEKTYYGDVVRNARKLEDVGNVIQDITVQNSISIVADAYATENFLAMKYISWSGVLWTVRDVEVQRPRLLLRLGGVYNGPTA